MLEDVERINSRRWNLSARISSALRSCRQQRRNDRTVRELLRQQRRAAAIAATAETTPERRRLPRGWWPDQGKREGLKLKAMNCLKDETFVISEEHFEYIFQEDESSEPNTPTQYESNLILPPEISSRQNKPFNRCTNECSICMLEYDVGDVVVCSKYCNHVFHQECILNWFSHSCIKSGQSNKSCPTCRCKFLDLDDITNDGQNENEDLGQNSMRGNRARSDTEDTAALSDSLEHVSRGGSSENENTLSPVAEN